MSRTHLSLVPDRPPEPLTEDEVITRAREAFVAARQAQVELASDLHLTAMLYQPGLRVNLAKLRGMRHEARRQLQRAQAVEAALSKAIAALEDAAR